MVEWDPIGFPSSLDSFATLTDDDDDVLANHPNTLADAVEALQAKVGINGSAVLSSLDYKSVHSSYRIPGMRYESASSIRVTTASGEMSSMYIPLNDGIFREADSDELLFDFSTGVDDLGLDTGTESSDTWYYLYGVPKTGDDTKYTVVASVSDPDTGPTDRDAYRYFGAFRNDGSSDILGFSQITNNSFRYLNPVRALTSAGTTEGSPTSLSMAAHVPETASLVIGYSNIQGQAGGWGEALFWIDGQQSGTALYSIPYSTNTYSHSQSQLEIPLPTTPKVIWYRRIVYSGVYANHWYDVHGWIDRYL